MENNTFKDLLVWQQAMDLAAAVYTETRPFPKEENFGLTSQIRRAATSIPANIAEGTGRGSKKDYQSFLRIARGSLRELETHLILANRVGYLSPEQLQKLGEQMTSVGKLLTRLIQSLNP